MVRSVFVLGLVLGVLLGIALGPVTAGAQQPAAQKPADQAAKTGPEDLPGARARRLLFSGQIARAVGVWEETLKLEPQNWDMLAATGAVLYADGQLPRAAAYLQRAVALRPDDTTLRLLLGTALHLAGDGPQAQAEFQKIAAGDAGAGAARIARDKLDGRYFTEQAASEARAAAKLGRKPERGMLWIGQLVETGWAKPDPALHDGGSPLAAAAGLSYPLQESAWAGMFAGGDYISLQGPVLVQIVSYAQNRYLVTARAWKGTPEENNAFALVRQLQFFDFFLEHVRTGSSKPALQEKLKSLTAAWAGKFADGVEFARAALRLAPDDPQARWELGYNYTNLRQLDAASKEQQAVLARWPDHARAHFELGVINGRQGRFDDAVKEFTEAISLNPTIWDVYLNLAIARAALKQMDKVCAAAVQLKEIVPYLPLPPALEGCGTQR